MLRIDSKPSLSQQLDTTFLQLDETLKSRDLRDNCRQLRTQTHEVMEIARNYDFRDVEANGFWTFAKLVIRFGVLSIESTTGRFKDDNETRLLLPVSQLLLSGLALCRQFHNERHNLFDSPPERFPELLATFKTLSPQLDVVYGSLCSFWLCESMRRAMTGFTTLMAVYSGNHFANWWHSSRNLWDRSLRAHTVAYIAQNATVEFVKSFWGLTENRFFRSTLPKLTNGLRIAKDIVVPQQTLWKISSTSATVSQQSIIQNTKESYVRCRLLSSSLSESLSVVLHLHGGGFVSQSPDSHEIYLRDWAQRLTDAAIVSVDYALSPQNKYPVALQQVLDVYLWLSSEESSKELGFKVKQIVVCGDSAGGNLSVALSLVIHQMAVIPKPKAILSFYAPLMLQTRGSASRLMTAVDTLLPLGVLLSCLEAYAPNQESDEDFEDFDDFIRLSNEDIPQKLEQWSPPWSLRVRHSMHALKERIVGQPESPLRPWYRHSETLNEKLKVLNHVTSNPFISPLLSSSHCLPLDIPLYLIGLHFDACLDDSIQMAKLWRGPVVLDVIDGLPHGFLNFVVLSPESKRASDLCLDRIKQSLH